MKYLLLLLALTFSLTVYSQQPVYVTITGGDLYSLDLENCTSTSKGSTGNGFGDIAFTPNGRLWGIVGGALYEIDTANANAMLVGPTGVPGIALVALNDSILLNEANQHLYAIKTTDATSYLIGNIGYSASGDLTWYDNDLYMTSAGQLVRITLNSTNTGITSVIALNSSSNVLPTCEGAATASFTSAPNSIIGFNGNNVIKICFEDGSHSMLCPGIVPAGMPGGASIRLTNVTPNECTVGIGEKVNESILQLFPDPFSSEATLKINMQLKDARLTITNCFGQTVRAIQSISSGSYTLNKEDIPDGVYFLTLSEGRTILATKKFVIISQ